MKKQYFIMAAISLFFLLSGILIGTLVIAGKVQNSYIPLLKIKGDIEVAYTLDSLESFKNSKTIKFNNKKINAVSLKDIIEKSNPLDFESSVFLIGEDGRVSCIDYDSIAESYIVFNSINGWESVNLNHPINANTKRLKEIAVVSDTYQPDLGINIISSTENIFSINPGKALLDSLNFLKLLGNTSMEKDGKKYDASIYSQNLIYDLEGILDSNNSNSDGNELLLMGEEGQYELVKNFGYVEIEDNQFNYLNPDFQITISKLKGILMNPPPLSNMDAYHDAMHYIGKDEKVMVILLDGFGYHQYVYSVENNFSPFLESLDRAKMASSVYQPVTNSGLAAIITGKPPYENGVYSREQRELKVLTIYKNLIEMDKKAALIEGNAQILKTEIEPELNLDENQNGTSDDEIFYNTLRSIKKDYDFILVHFHSIDDCGHNYGDLSRETMNTIGKIDSYLADLVANWKGKVIITSDHGMHPTPDGGSHGEFRFEDMIVPYIITDGGNI